MNNILIEIAGFKIKINFKKKPLEGQNAEFAREKLRGEILVYCKDFIFDSQSPKIDFTINITQGETYKDVYKKNSTYFFRFYDKKGDKIMTSYKISIVQFQMILHDVLHTLLSKHNGVRIHASAIGIDNRAFLFAGNSGAGKSTSATLLGRKFPILADDGSIFKKNGSEWNFYQSPIVEKPWWIKKTSRPYSLGGIFFIHKSSFFKIEKVNNSEEILEKMIKQTNISPRHRTRIIKSLFSFVKEFKGFYFLHFAKDDRKMISLFENFLHENI